MKRVSVIVETAEQAAQIEEMLKQIDYVSNIETNDETLSGEEIMVLKERMDDYEKNKTDILDWEDVLPEMISKYGK